MSNNAILSLRAGEWVEVRTKGEILSTLDANGRLDELPFMPEMLQYCGRRLQVGKRAHKTCDPALCTVGRQMRNAVHLENLRCNGSAHDGCEARCLLFWKEAWLRRVDAQADNVEKPANGNNALGAKCTEQDLWSRTKIPANGESEPTYVCQNTQVKFATTPLQWWDIRQYVEDYTSGNVRISQLAAGSLYSLWSTVAEAGVGVGWLMRWAYDRFRHATAHVGEHTLGWLHVAAGHSDRWMRWGFYSSLFQLAALCVGMPFGLTGVATAHAIATFCLVVPTLVYAGRPFGIGARDVLGTVGPPMAAGLITVVIGLTAQQLFLADYSRLARLTISTFVCLVAYFTVAVGVFRVTGPIQLGLSLLHDFTAIRWRNRL